MKTTEQIKEMIKKLEAKLIDEHSNENVNELKLQCSGEFIFKSARKTLLWVIEN